MKLLISPKDIEETKAAIRGNADIIDVKNPFEGSLGANFPWVIKSIKEFVEKEAPGKEISAAIGDFDYKPGTAALAALGTAFAGVKYIKVGLYKIRTREEAINLLKSVVRAIKEYAPDRKVVSAFYSDYKRLNTIQPFEIAEIGKNVEIDVAMVDTGIKDGKSTLAFLSEEELKEFVSEAKALSLESALAGSLKFEDARAIKRIGADIIGVRGAVCDGDRRGRINEALVKKLKDMIA